MVGFFKGVEGSVEAHLGGGKGESGDVGDFLQGEAGHEFEDDDFAFVFLELVEGELDVLTELFLLGGVVAIGHEDI